MSGYQKLSSSQQAPSSNILALVLNTVRNALASLWSMILPVLTKLMQWLVFLSSLVTPVVWVLAFGGIAYLILFMSPTKVSRKMGYWSILIALLPIAIVLWYILWVCVTKKSCKKAFQCARQSVK